MPKGADLHVHLSGAVYAESFIRAAVEDNLCVDVAALAFVKPQSISNTNPPMLFCGEGKVPAANALTDQHLYDALIDSFSMRSFVPSTGVSGHDHFFDSFAKFGGTDKRHVGEWVDEVTNRAALQNEQYMELMHTPKSPRAGELSASIPFTEDFESLRQQLLKEKITDDVTVAKDEIDKIEAVRKQKGHCGEPKEAAGCKVQVRYLYQVLRGLPKSFVFAQTLVAFETALADKRFVGLNYVMPEDGYVSMSDYALHMRMLAFFHKAYPGVHLSLHAGELAPGLVTPDGLCCHIKLAVEEVGAERIGHGVDLAYENNPKAILLEMADRHVMVEINLSSNDLILGISGKDHPFPVYRHNSVPVALSTDDEGVSRIDLTHEYVRAVQTYDLHYADLKKMVRTSLEHSFLPGDSLWRARDDFAGAIKACSKDTLGAEKKSFECEKFLNSSERAQQQWELEHRFTQFESTFPSGTPQ
jgi:adenosine deaminase